MTHRIGTFLMLVGMLMLGLFILSDIAQSPACGFLIIGGILLLLGIFLWFRDPTPPPQETGRFRILKGAGKKQEKKK